MHILQKIVAHKKKEVQQLKEILSTAELEMSPHFDRTCNSYTARLNSPNEYGIIAEFKRKSPSKSNINLTANLLECTAGYRDAGAAAISVLTDEHFFGGQLHYLTQVRQHLADMPLLRKDFIIDEFQVLQSKALGADIILLIGEILTVNEVLQYAKLANSLGMEVLLEMHSAEHIDKYNQYVSIVGVNNRDLSTFEVDYERSKQLYNSLPSDVPKIAESGLSQTATCQMLYDHGFRGFLIGEHFMRGDNPGLACQQFIDQLKQGK